MGFLLEDNFFFSHVNDDKKTVSNIISQWFVRQKTRSYEIERTAQREGLGELYPPSPLF